MVRLFVQVKRQLSAEAAKAGHLRHLGKDCLKMLDKATAMIEVNHYQDSPCKVVNDKV